MKSIPKRLVMVALSGLFTLGVAYLGAHWGAEQAISSQQRQAEEHVDHLRELIRFEVAHNARVLRSSAPVLQGAASELVAYIQGESPAPDLSPGYTGLATVGLRAHLGGPFLIYADHRILAAYSLAHDRLVQHRENQVVLDDAAAQYASALYAEEKRRAAAALLTAINFQLLISGPLISMLPVLHACMDQFSAGENECEYTDTDLLSAFDQGEPEQEPTETTHP